MGPCATCDAPADLEEEGRMRDDIVYRLTCLLCTVITHFKAPLSEVHAQLVLSLHLCTRGALVLSSLLLWALYG